MPVRQDWRPRGRVEGGVRAGPLDLLVANFSSGWSTYAARENRRTFCCVTGVEVVVIVVAIILGIAILIGAVLFARRLDRDEPGPTIVRRRYSDSPDYWGG